MTEPLTGLIAAPYSPLDASGDLALGVVEKQYEHLKGTGVRGVFVCGTTGEGLALTTDERLALAARWFDVADDDFVVLVHVGHTSARDSVALIEAAAARGARGVGTLPPIYHKPATVDALVSYCAGLASAAPGVPFYYYHIPGLSGVTLPMRAFLERGKERIPNLGGVKFTFEDLRDYQMCLELDGGRYDVLFGRDEMLLAGLALGAKGAIGSTYNYAAPLYVRLWDAFRRGDMDEARACQRRSQQMIETLARYGGVLSAGKALMGLIGVDCGPCRPPLPTPTEKQARALKADLERIGYFEWSRGA